MTALRTTLLAGLAAVLLCGCGGPGPDAAAYRPALTHLPPPPPDRIGFDDRTRTLYLPDAPPAARWMVEVPGAGPPNPAGPEVRLPDGADPDDTFVFYQRPGGQHSGRVSVAQVLAARDAQASHTR